MGLDLRTKSKNILFLIHKASIDKNNRKTLLKNLRDEAEEIKHFLSIRASFLAHIKHCNGYREPLKIQII